MHLSESRLLTHLDGELPREASAEVEGHLSSCASCRRTFVRLQARTEAVGRLLGSIDVEPPTQRVRGAVERARTTPSRRRGSGRADPSWWSRRSRLAQAALLLLILCAVGGLSAALPGSPLRSWLASRGEAPVDGGVEAGAERTAVVGEPLAGALTVTLGGLRRGDVVDVEWTDVEPPRVRAPSGSRYRVVPGAVFTEIARPSGPEDGVVPVRVTVELPRALSDVVIEAGGEALVTKRAGSVELGSAVTDSSASTLRFEVGGG